MWDPVGEVGHLLRHHHQQTVQTYVLYYDNQDQDLYELLQHWHDIWTEGITTRPLHRRGYQLGMRLYQKYQEYRVGHHQCR